LEVRLAIEINGDSVAKTEIRTPDPACARSASCALQRSVVVLSFLFLTRIVCRPKPVGVYEKSRLVAQPAFIKLANKKLPPFVYLRPLVAVEHAGAAVDTQLEQLGVGHTGVQTLTGTCRQTTRGTQ